MQLDLGTSSLSLLASLLLPLPDCDVIHTDSLDAWLIDKELVSLNFDLVHLQSTKVPNLHITHNSSQSKPSSKGYTFISNTSTSTPALSLYGCFSKLVKTPTQPESKHIDSPFSSLSSSLPVSRASFLESLSLIACKGIS